MRGCRACDGLLTPVVDMGMHPGGGRFPRAGELPDVLLPLRMGICGSCGLAQLADESPAEDDEPDGPSPLSSATMTAHARAFVDDVLSRDLATGSSPVLSVASHGGHLAPFLTERGVQPTILEGSAERARRLSAAGDGVITGSLDADSQPAGLVPGVWDLIVDSYLLAHLERPRLALGRLLELLAPGGTLVLEFDSLLATVVGGQWDALRHGHRAYLSLGWVVREVEAAGFAVLDAVPQTVYGGALRLFVRATTGGPKAQSVANLLALEAASAIDRPAGLVALGQAMDAARDTVVAHLREMRDAGRLVVGYGAPARSITFLNALGIGPDLLPYVVDRATAKQGRVIPGVRIPIRGPEVLEDDPPDEILILTWDLAGEIRASLASPRLSRTRFLVAVPRLTNMR